MVARLKRLAAVDIGTNSVLLLVAERGADGKLRAVADEAEITRLGRGVDRTGLLSPEGMSATLAVLERYVQQARAAAAQDIVVTATSAARDARNGAEFLQAARTRTGVEVRVISGEEEAGLSYRAATDDFASEAGGRPLLVIDVGGGSTEFVLGKGRAVSFARSLDIGSVRLTERCIHSDPPLPVEQAAVRRAVEEALQTLPPFPSEVLVVGVAGTVTNLFSVAHGIEPYDPVRVHGGWLSVEEVAAVRARLCAIPVEERRRLPGIQPKRADVLPTGALLFESALVHLGVSGTRVSDRGIRWGILLERMGGDP
jgi:exopolyphosphatase / guanosine-5'-triphosphate,3'-diphosphate pyrophosphatase